MSTARTARKSITQHNFCYFYKSDLTTNYYSHTNRNCLPLLHSSKMILSTVDIQLDIMISLFLCGKIGTCDLHFYIYMYIYRSTGNHTNFKTEIEFGREHSTVYTFTYEAIQKIIIAIYIYSQSCLRTACTAVLHMCVGLHIRVFIHAITAYAPLYCPSHDLCKIPTSILSLSKNRLV